MSPASLHPLNALIRRCIDLQQLCRQAAGHVAEPGLRAVLEENAAALDRLILDLQMQLAARGGRPPTQGRMGDTLARALAASWPMHASAHRDARWIASLAHCEALLQQAFERSCEAAAPDCLAMLDALRPRLESLHLDIDGLAAASVR